MPLKTIDLYALPTRADLMAAFEKARASGNKDALDTRADVWGNRSHKPDDLFWKVAEIYDDLGTAVILFKKGFDPEAARVVERAKATMSALNLI